MIIAQVLSLAATALFASARAEEVNVADALFNLETRQVVAPACNATFNDNLYLPSQDPNIGTRTAILNLISPGFTHTARVPGLPPAVNGPTGAGWAEGDYLQFSAVNLPYEQKNGALKLQTLLAFQATGVASFSSIQSLKQVYAYIPTPQALQYDPTTDAYFGHSRLTFAAHYITAVKALPFTLTSAQTTEVTALLDTADTIANALANNRIFVEDHSSYNWTLNYVFPGRYVAIPTAVFYYSNKTGNMIPLAIKTHTVKGYVVSPSNGQDWLLAKIMVNNFHTWRCNTVDHFMDAHMVFEPLQTSRLRTMGDAHPISVYLAAALKQNTGNALAGVRLLLPPLIGAMDMNFAINSTGILNAIAKKYTTWSFYQNNPATDYIARGVPSTTPIVKFSSALYAQILKTATKLVNIYYGTDGAVAADVELQNWAKDAVVNGKVVGLPSSITTMGALAGVLAQISYVTGVHHHVLNTYTVHQWQDVMTFPMSLYAPIPTAVGTVNATNIVKWLPGPVAAVNQVGFTINFNRPLAAYDSLYWAFNNTALNSPRTACVWADYRAGMDAVSANVQATAAADTIFKWTILDPNNLPNYVYV
ncbi:Mitogen-activated protein kinase 4a [Blyttiomyces sp. JEL0837]|nr:Mitogen-activated protein kinase 4a [Blyttiomyces sp. JEL0837]